MQNVEMEVKEGKLVITVDLEKKGEVSKSGKSLVIGSTKGNKGVSDAGFDDVKVGLNVYKPVV